MFFLLDLRNIILWCRIELKLFYLCVLVLFSLSLHCFFEFFVNLLKIRRVSYFHHTLRFSSFFIRRSCLFSLLLQIIFFHSRRKLCLGQVLLSSLCNSFFSDNFSIFFFLQKISGTVPRNRLSLEYKLLSFLFSLLIDFPILETKRPFIGKSHYHAASFPILILFMLIRHHLLEKTNLRYTRWNGLSFKLFVLRNCLNRSLLWFS